MTVFKSDGIEKLLVEVELPRGETDGIPSVEQISELEDELEEENEADNIKEIDGKDNVLFNASISFNASFPLMPVGE